MKHEYEFLPAVLEVTETPPSPVGRMVSWTLLALIGLALLWACLGQIDIVAVGTGKIVPIGKSKTIQPLEAGVVTAIRVSDGQTVKKGQALLDLDPTISEADRQRLAQELQQARADALRSRMLGERLRSCGKSAQCTHRFNNPPANSGLQESLLLAQWQEYDGKRQALLQALEQRKGELNVTAANIERLEKTLPLISERAKALKDLAARKLASHHEALTLEQQRLDTELGLKAEQEKRPMLSAAIAQAREQLAGLLAETERVTYEQRAQAEQKVAGLTQELAKAEQRTRLQTLTSPIAGTVQNLSVTTLGGVVTPAQALMVIVPKDEQLDVEVAFENKDIGFIAKGQSAEVKIEAFPFTKYGVIDGTLTQLSQDATIDEKTGQLYYAGRVALKQAHIMINQRAIKLSAGMAVAVELKTGKRRVIEYLLEPVMTTTEQSLGER